LLHEALRKRLGAHVAQKGSLVEPNRLRFDFSHTKPLSPEDLAAVEQMANSIVAQNDAVTTRLMSVDAAIAEGAMALFGEKYGEEVRVVSMGHNGSDEARAIYSLELCGGTHVRRTGDIGLIKILADSGSSAGVRRMEALAGSAARDYLNAQDARVAQMAAVLKVPEGDVVARVEALVEEKRRIERELTEARKALAMGGGGAGGSAIVDVNGIKFMGKILKGVSPQDLKPMADEGKKAVQSGIVALLAVSDDGKGAVVVAVTEDLTARFNAVDLVKIGSIAMGGKGGGGRPDMAQAGGPDGAKAQSALEAIQKAL
jgi:alanyl-tRNA synthetase